MPTTTIALMLKENGAREEIFIVRHLDLTSLDYIILCEPTRSEPACMGNGPSLGRDFRPWAYAQKFPWRRSSAETYTTTEY